ncbi:G-type lectin S-receptor-like serine/threonine-protein kinase RLK1 [Coffea arabica]|uniref:Receptor-like serine/threonine-protein kinase n=1 Tax=Coffea arabica TaxID=13443 RepID=A0A6P6URS7_COFAR
MRPKLAMAYTFFHLIFFILLIPLCSLAQNNGIVPIGSILTANEASNTWLSPSGDFAFGFQQPDDKDLFLLSIWYHNIPQKTVVWYVNSSDSIPRGSTVKLDAQIGLVLRDPQGVQLWSTNAISDQLDHGFMNDTGNFVLKGRDNSSLWESFSFPADTILPLQELETGSVLNSRQSETNFSQGRFSLQFLDNGDLVLTARSLPNTTYDDVVYYNSQTSKPTNTSNSGYRLVFGSRGIISIVNSNNQTEQIGSPTLFPPVAEDYFRATLDSDGILASYYHPRNFTGNQNWTVLWSEPDDICSAAAAETGSGACGYNSICNLVNGRPACECPDGYTLLDPNDKSGSCMPNSTPSCDEVEQGTAGELYDFVVINGTDWPKSDYQIMRPSTEIGCREACLHDCFCAAAIFRNNTCYKKKLPLSNGWTRGILNTVAFLKYRKSDAPPGMEGPSSRPKDRETLIVVESVLLGSSFFLNILLIVAACSGFYLIYKKKMVKSRPNGATNLRYFTYKELVEATNGFKEELGRGSFGIVYKGELQISSKSSGIAVKKLDRVAQDTEKEFRAEVNTIGQTNHKNLVRLLGFCDEGQNRLLVYEYMRNGTLSSFLFTTPKPSWKLRTQIAMGIARGLTYLHEECSTQIIHCDIKPQNILLDDYYNARISDFGMAKLLAMNQSRTLTNIRGTKGYVAPEWFRNTQVTAKVDVYSFGVLLLEIICCRRSVENIESVEEGYAILTDWVWDCFQERRLDTLVENDSEALNDKMMLERFVKVGIWCVQEDSSIRPTMRKVSQMLEGIVEVMVPPCPSPFAS